MAKRCWLVVGLLALTACSGNKAKQTCEKAAKKYVTCIGELLGPEMAAIAGSKDKDGVAACAKDKKTVEMYRSCLGKDACDEFLDCLEDYATRTGGTPTPDGSRKEQCQHHVKEGLRGIAMQVVMMSEARTDSSKRTARSCVLDESKPYDGCLEAAEVIEVGRYGEQRQRDCEAWEPLLAACILKLEGAKNCNSDEYPFWREPIEAGKPGPPVAWSAEVVEKDGEPRFVISADGTLTIADRSGLLSTYRGGEKLMVLEGIARELILVGDYAIRRDSGGLHVIDVKKGDARGGALLNLEVVAIAADGDAKALALTSEGELYRVVPESCPGKRCATKLAKLGQEDLPYEPLLARLDGGTILVGDTEIVHVFSPKGQRLLSVTLRDYGAEHIAAVPGGHIAVIDDGGGALLSVSACMAVGKDLYLPSAVHLDRSIRPPREKPEDCDGCKLAGAGCVTAYQKSLLGSWQIPAPLPGGAIAWNDHGMTEKTLFVSAAKTWAVKTGGHGKPAGDDTLVYTVSFGQDSEGPVRLLALARETGKIVWQTDITDAKPETDEYSDVETVLGGRHLAARVADRIYVFELPE